MGLTIAFYVTIFVFGIVIGSFLNVLIYRIPRHENIAVVRSHCMQCGYQLKWYDLFPIFSYLFLRGKCRKCKAKISVQYPLVEALNGILYVVVFAFMYQQTTDSLLCCVLYCMLGSALLALSVIDFRTYEIPVGFNLFIGLLGVARIVTDYENWLQYVIGGVSVSLFLLLLFVLSNGRAIGGGDVKLMAACGLLLGWKSIILAFCIGCLLGGIIHPIRMKIAGEGRVLAMGPYLSIGVMIAALFGTQLINQYLEICGL
ncbi:MAG: prepilin peptidase [Lachnospiraceae bacterium]